MKLLNYLDTDFGQFIVASILMVIFAIIGLRFAFLIIAGIWITRLVDILRNENWFTHENSSTNG